MFGHQIVVFCLSANILNLVIARSHTHSHGQTPPSNADHFQRRHFTPMNRPMHSAHPFASMHPPHPHMTQNHRSELIINPDQFETDPMFRAGYGLAGINGQPFTAQSEMHHSVIDSRPANSPFADFSANGAGFISSDLHPEATTNRLLDALVDEALAKAKRPRQDYATGDSNTTPTATDSDLANYLKEAAANEAAEVSSKGISRGPENFVPAARAQLALRKPSERVVEEQHILDPEVAKHLLKNQVSRELESNYGSGYSGSLDLSSLAGESDLSQYSSLNELASRPSPADFLTSGILSPSQDHLFSQLQASNNLQALRGLGSSSFSSPSLMSTPLATSSMPMVTPFGSPMTRGPTGLPPGALIGAPGSAPPPGMKLAGYVTMTNPNPQPNPMMSQSMMSPMMSPMGAGMQSPLGNPVGSPMASMANPMASPMGNMMANPMMYQAMMGQMGQAMKNPQMQQMLQQLMGGSGSQNQLLQSLLGGATGQIGQSTNPLSSTTGAATSASTPQSSRAKFFSRLNPMNLFKRLRSRNQPTHSQQNASTHTAPQSSEEDIEDRVINYPDNSQDMSYSESIHRPLVHRFVIGKRGKHRVARSIDSQVNDTVAAENGYFPIGHFERGLFRPERIRFPGNRRTRRIQGRRGNNYVSESRRVGLMGSGNFEVIRGGLFPGNQRPNRPYRMNKPEHYEEDEEEENGEVGNIFSALDDDFFGAGSPGILGFQGFNNFQGSNVYNALSSSNQKNEILANEASKRADGA